MKQLFISSTFALSVTLLSACGEKTANITPPSNDPILSTLTESAQAGAKDVAVCNSCHNVALDPPKAPPLFGVSNRYKKAFPDKETFVAAVVDFVAHPSMDKVIMKRPAQKMGLMPPMPLPKEQLSNIANYLYEYPFPPPCEHWKIAVKNAEKKGEVDNHIAQDKKKIQRFCQ
ncbi:MAG: Unknown protein [uncultured Thiotrichaceae bacterium]|uniref:Cytochrome c domain-containing protein n=1 Tax=uncultured Thiotrichaceae bacterium TaxID=298394 RepID=A0A6S6UAK6_9GAMM|nr:MAG: Unknown protein [uncultured Thiotrichaceae bacterium]